MPPRCFTVVRLLASCFLLFLPCWASTTSTTKLVIGVDGGTESIRACCFNARDGKVVGTSCAVPYRTYHPQPGWAEQNPKDWWENLGLAVRGAVGSLDQNENYDICALCVDTTCCSVVALDRNGEPLRPCLLWMDARSSRQTQEVFDKCRGDPALQVNCGGEGPLSAEWMIPKALWIRQEEPHIWEQAASICEYQDYINFKLTGVLCASWCNAATRWHWDGADVSSLTAESSSKSPPGRPISLYEKLGIPELAQKLPQTCLPMGACVGQLTEEAAQHLNLPRNLLVAQGGADAFVGMIGLGCIHPGQLCLITGSSHLHCVVTDTATRAPGTWGAYRGALPLPDVHFAEGGQSSTGSLMRWAKKLFSADSSTQPSYKTMDMEAADVPIGCDGLVALETFQGARTPTTDPMARGAFVGLTLAHTRAHLWRALMEAVCYGTRACIDGLANAGHGCQEIIMAGGTTQSELWLQMHADVTGKPVVLCENSDAPMLGCAVLASVGAGIHTTVEDAVNAMIRVKRRIDPDTKSTEAYNKIYESVYRQLVGVARPVTQTIATLRGGESKEASQVSPHPILSPSLLACDWGNMQGEVERCLDAGLLQFHVDIFDGVSLDSPLAFTFGPKMVQAIRRTCDVWVGDTRPILDLHMCVDRPSRFVEPMADAGADRFIFQWEALEEESSSPEKHLSMAIGLAEKIVESGMKCGLSVNPRTDIRMIYPLLETGLVDLVDILAVEPGFGGQSLQENCLSKVQDLKRWKEHNMPDLLIMVDGGVNERTFRQVMEAGADILVSGSFLFEQGENLKTVARDLLTNPSLQSK